MEDLETVFVFLDDLRASGQTNMFGAGAYLEDEFEMTRKEARRVLGLWMNTFDTETPVKRRAVMAAALAAQEGGA